MSEEFPDPLAAFDQLLRSIVDIAKVIRGYYMALRAEGFTDAEALELTVAFQTQLQRTGQE